MQEGDSGGGRKVCDAYALLIRSAVGAGLNNSGGRLTPKQAEAARTIARKDKTYHQGGSGFGHGELNHLNEVVVGGTITTE